MSGYKVSELLQRIASGGNTEFVRNLLVERRIQSVTNTGLNYGCGGVIHRFDDGGVTEYNGGVLPASHASVALTRSQWNELYQQGKVKLDSIPRKYQSWIVGENSELKHRIQDTINTAGKKYAIPLTLGSAVAPIGGSLLGLAASLIKPNLRADRDVRDRSEIGGYTNSEESRLETNASFDPRTGFSQLNYNQQYGNRSTGEANEYWRAYLGLDNVVPKMNPDAKTEWDDKVEHSKKMKGEFPSDFYGITPRMEQMLQVIADTTNLGKIIRNYDSYKDTVPTLVSQRLLKNIYEQGKTMMNNPEKWTQMQEPTALRDATHSFILYSTQAPEVTDPPIGHLANFGMKWSPSSNALYVHDTFDFPAYTRVFIPKRPIEMKIRGKVDFDPKRGSELLRDGLDPSKYAEPIIERERPVNYFNKSYDEQEYDEY